MASCVACHRPLTVEVDHSDEEDNVPTSSAQACENEDVVPDDVELTCGCHFHWECLLEAYDPSTTSTLRLCPSCSRSISQDNRIICNLNNEGGLQQNLDIRPLLEEEAYLRAHPEDRICRAFVELCREGDVSAIVDLLRMCDSPPDEDSEEAEAVQARSADEVLRWQDPLADGQSGLHAAVAGGSREVAWLLLLCASAYPELDMPALVWQEAAAMGIMRSDQSEKVDIRSLRDANGRTAEDLAADVDGVWHGWVGSGRLAMDGMSGGSS